MFMHVGSPCWVVEIGYTGGMMLPTDWYCLPRNLGFKYWLSLANSGDYGSPMHANADELAAIATEYRKYVEALPQTGA